MKKRAIWAWTGRGAPLVFLLLQTHGKPRKGDYFRFRLLYDLEFHGPWTRIVDAPLDIDSYEHGVGYHDEGKEGLEETVVHNLPDEPMPRRSVFSRLVLRAIGRAHSRNREGSVELGLTCCALLRLLHSRRGELWYVSVCRPELAGGLRLVPLLLGSWAQFACQAGPPSRGRKATKNLGCSKFQKHVITIYS